MSSDSTDSTPHATILIVNYHTDTNKACTRILARYGYEAFAVESLAAASEALTALQFDILLCRQTATDGEPLDFIRETRQRFPHLPIIAFGGGLNEHRIRELREAGAEDCIYIPFDTTNLVALLRKHTATPAKR
jgi:DNA-binding NtrC family response regulator